MFGKGVVKNNNLNDVKNTNILLISEFVPHYRIPIYNILNKRRSLTVLHSQANIDVSNCEFNHVYVKSWSIGPFNYFNINLNKFCKGFKVVIAENNIRFLDRNFLILFPWRKYKWISWGIGQAASYNKKLGDQDFYKKIRLLLQKKSDAIILYSDFSLKLLLDSGIDPGSIFIANNTVSLQNVALPDNYKKNILFIGSLYKQKKINELLYAYRSALDICSDLGNLLIIGDGTERVILEKLSQSLNLEKKVTFLGNIEDNKLLSGYFSKALICISPGQAGLSVLTSMANSVPFVTRTDAITGGEIFNINNGGKITGVIYEKKDDLITLLCDTVANRNKYMIMGENARKYYKRERSPELMVESIINAVKFVSNPQRTE
jgi:glycosyltransferase involved in cell wall biosynthesis